MGLQRKKVTVRTKKGKVYQRSMLVKSAKGGARRAGKLHSLNPWETRHTELVKGPFPKSSGSSGPGSDHSMFALLVGRNKDLARGNYAYSEPDSFTAQHAEWRRRAGETAVRNTTSTISGHNIYANMYNARLLPTTELRGPFANAGNARVASISRAFGGQVSAVRQNSRKWVRE
jgi:hypothetical protein